MKTGLLAPVLLVTLAGLQGCATQASQQQLEQAAIAFQNIGEDPQVLHDAPRDVMRAAESLERAERFASYWGSAENVGHYAYLSQLNPKRRVRIEGYTDNRGDAAGNLALSKARAQAVGEFIQSLGIDAPRMEMVGYGEQYRVAENASARGRAQNRRVEILFSDEQGRLSRAR